MPMAISRTHRPCVQLFRLVDWAQVRGLNQSHSAARLRLPGDGKLVTAIFLATAIRVEATADPLHAPCFLRDLDVAFSRVSLTLNFTIFVIKSNGTGASSGN